MKILELFKNQKLNGFSNEVLFIGGRLHLIASGKFDGAKIKYQVSYDDGKTYHDYLVMNDEAAIQDFPGKMFYIVEDGEVKIRAILSNASNNTNISLNGYYNQYYSPKYNLIALT